MNEFLIGAPGSPVQVYLTQSVRRVVFKRSIPTQIRQLILYISNSKGHVDARGPDERVPYRRPGKPRPGAEMTKLKGSGSYT